MGIILCTVDISPSAQAAQQPACSGQIAQQFAGLDLSSIFIPVNCDIFGTYYAFTGIVIYLTII